MSETYKTGPLSEITPMPDEVIVDDSLVLRNLAPSDAEELLEIIRNNPEIGQNVTWPAGVENLESALQRVEGLLEDKDKVPYVLEERGTIIGYVGTWGNEGDESEIGFSYFLDKNKRGQGFITRAVKHLMGTVKETLPVDTFVLNIIDGNEPSKTIATKLGFKSTDKLTYDQALQAYIRRYERSA